MTLMPSVITSAGGPNGGGGGGNAFMFERFLDSKLFEVLDRYSSGKPAMIFCASRNGK